MERADRELFSGQDTDQTVSLADESWTWLQLASPERERLVERTRFLLGLQGLIDELRPIQVELDRRALVVEQQDYARVAADVEALEDVTRRAHRQLAAMLHRCEQVHVPPIPTLAQPIDLAALLGVQLPVKAPEHDPFERAVELLDAITQTIARLSRVHDRMIGAMLELHDQAERSDLS